MTIRHVDDTTYDDGSLDDRTIIRTRPRTVRVERQDWVHLLVVVEGLEPGRRFEVGDKPLTVGRKAPCDVLVVEAEVSGRHCELRRKQGSESLIVTDLNSTNGSFVDGLRVAGSTELRHGALLQVGRQVMRHDFMPRHELHASAELDRDLEKASRYVQSLLPAPLREGPILTDWVLQPSARLGGDAFGWQALDEQRLASYLIDVSGHGTGAAMHTVSVLNVLRQKALPDTDFTRPEQVLARLNDMFQMDSHAGLYFTVWYGVYDRATRMLDYGCAGHHAGYLVDKASGAMQALHTRNLMIGALPGARFKVDRVAVKPNDRLYLFSDGVFEIVTLEGTQWGLSDFLPLILLPDMPELGEAERLHRHVRRVARPGPFDDDFTILVTTFAA